MADTHTYNYNDIQRYLQQQMTAKEMHAFEKAMMDDPFLADALEGFQKSDADVANGHIQEIEQQINRVKERGKVVPMIPAARRWWRIAALFIVIAGIGFITYRLTNKISPVNEIAGKVDITSEATTDTLKPVDRTFTQPRTFKEEPPEIEQKSAPVIKETNEGLIASSKKPKQHENEGMQSAMRSKSEVVKEKVIALSAPIAEKPGMQNYDLKKQIPLQKFEGQVVDNRGRPLSSASISINNNSVVLTDSNGSFSIAAPDSTLEVNASLVGFAPATAKIGKEKANKIVLNESKLALNDIVVTGYGVRKNKNQLGVNKATLPANKPTNAEPQTGWQSFHEYVNASLKIIKDTATNYISREVHLEFTIDSNGHPSEIKVLRGVNAATNAKAIELLQKGPLWKQGKNYKSTVVIRF